MTEMGFKKHVKQALAILDLGIHTITPHRHSKQFSSHQGIGVTPFPNVFCYFPLISSCCFHPPSFCYVHIGQTIPKDTGQSACIEQADYPIANKYQTELIYPPIFPVYSIQISLASKKALSYYIFQ